MLGWMRSPLIESSQGRSLRLFLHVLEVLMAISVFIVLIMASWHPSPGGMVVVGLGGIARASRGILDLRWLAKMNDSHTDRREPLGFLIVLGLVLISSWFAYLLWPFPLILCVVWLAWMLANGLEVLRWMLETAFIELLTSGHGSDRWLIVSDNEKTSSER